MPSLELVWNLIARDGASPAFARAGASAEGASKAVGGLLKTMGAFAAGAAVVEAIKSAAEFQSKMALIQTQAGATAAEVRKMSPAILSLAGRVAQALRQPHRPPHRLPRSLPLPSGRRSLKCGSADERNCPESRRE